MKLIWNKSDRNYIAKSENFVFRLLYQDIGVLGYGKCYGLQVRKTTESKYEYLRISFVISDDGYRAVENCSVDKKIWENRNDILNRAEELLEDNGFNITI